MERREGVRRSYTSDQQNYQRQASPSPEFEEPYEEENTLGFNWRFARYLLILEVAVFICQTVAAWETRKHAHAISNRYHAAVHATLGLIAALYLTKIWSRKHVSSTAMLFFMLGNTYMHLFAS